MNSKATGRLLVSDSSIALHPSLSLSDNESYFFFFFFGIVSSLPRIVTITVKDRTRYRKLNERSRQCLKRERSKCRLKAGVF